MRTIRLGSLFGIPILIHPAWFVLFGTITALLAFDFYPRLLDDRGPLTHGSAALLSAVLFFASILLHELAHSLVAKLYQIPVKSITLFIFGGVAQISREAAKPFAELIMAAAGPLTSFLLGFLFFGLWVIAGADDETAVQVVLLWLTLMNAVLGAFNLLPAFPMDGGRVFRSLIWLVTGSYNAATNIAGWTGRGIAWLMIGTGFLAVLGYDMKVADGPVNGGWLILVGLFLENAARQGLLQNRVMRTLGKYRAGDLMTANPPVVDAEISVAALARGVLEINPRVCYFVEAEGRLAGILSAYQMRAVPEALWDTTSASEAMVPRERLRATSPERPVADVLMEMESEELLHMPVVAEGQVVGVIARDRIIGVLRQAGMLPG